MVGEKTDEFLSFNDHKREMKTASFRIWTRVIDSTSFDGYLISKMIFQKQEK